MKSLFFLVDLVAALPGVELTRRRVRGMIDKSPKKPTRLKSYMHFFMPQITTVILLVHLALGCCWHHAHRCVGMRHEAASAGERAIAAAGLAELHEYDSPACERHACEHGLPHQETPHHGPDRHEHQCEGDRCTFVRSEQSGEQEAQLLSLLQDGFPPTFAFHVATDLSHASFTPLADDLRDTAPSSPRAHLLYCVLLI